MDKKEDSSDIYRVNLDDREIILVGTAHISKESAELTREVIANETPNAVCIELDDKRLEALKDPDRWKSLDLQQIIKKKQFITFIVSLMGSSWQKRLGDQTGALPGSEFLAAIESAEELDAPIYLCDREMSITLKRVWRLLPLRHKFLFIFSLFRSLFEKDQLDINEEQLKDLRQQDAIQSIIDEWGQWLPTVKQALLDERDIWMAEEIKKASGDKVVAIVGAAHVAGIKDNLFQDNSGKIDDLKFIPPASNFWKIAGWGFPVLIIGSILLIGWNQGLEKATDNAWYWFLANGIPCSLGALIAWAHPLTIITAFIAAPFTSLTPVIGAAYVTAFVQAWMCPPKIQEFHSLGDDLAHIKKWWSNRVLKVFLAFILPGLGSTIGSVVGGLEIFRNLFN